MGDNKNKPIGKFVADGLGSVCLYAGENKLQDTIPTTIYHKNLRRVVYVIGDVAGREEAPFYGILDVRKAVKSLPNPYGEVKELWMSCQLWRMAFM